MTKQQIKCNLRECFENDLLAERNLVDKNVELEINQLGSLARIQKFHIDLQRSEGLYEIFSGYPKTHVFHQETPVSKIGNMTIRYECKSIVIYNRFLDTPDHTILAEGDKIIVITRDNDDTITQFDTETFTDCVCFVREMLPGEFIRSGILPFDIAKVLLNNDIRTSEVHVNNNGKIAAIDIYI